VQERPFIMMKREKHYVGNDRFYGYGVDLLDAIAAMIGFEYTLELVPDGVYGVQDPETGEWSGIVRQLMTYVMKPDLCGEKDKKSTILLLHHTRRYILIPPS
jgi:hypothetical protein